MTSRTTRIRAAAVLLTATALTVSACGGNDPGTDEGAAGEVEGSTIVLTTITGLAPQFEQYADAYMDAFPDRTVEVRSSTDDAAEYSQQLATGRISGELPDVFFNVDFLADTLATNNVTLDLAPGIEEGKLGDLRLDDFLPQFVGQYRPLDNPEQVTGLPVSADSVGLFYNKTLFDQYGITEYPEADWTWDDMLRVGEQITTASGGDVIGLAAPLGSGADQIVFGPVIQAFGGFVYDPDTQTSGIGQPEAIEAWELMLSAFDSASGPYTATPDPTVNFNAGNVAMAIASRGGVPQVQATLVDVDWDVQVLPTIDGNSTAGGGSYGLSIAQTSTNQDAAWAFLAWFYDTDAGMLVAQEVGGAIPPTEDGIDNGIWRDVSPPPANIAIFGESARTAVLLTQMPGATSAVLTEATTTATQQVILEGRDVAEAFQEAEAIVNAALAEETGE
ncbi:extracellular solute-binding protein [Occultella gossypii]|uniref:Extracellular solute-binding protein n=1 Tax=Occultella gossypii TaxID=2800820 RepID=A0ABS7SAI2_9MICO|nr:extracellular solute-binding protein [Occultella gossypii]MBZ2196253.1 extracellular solute-binding protein [Occultella gossypii]